MKVLVLGGTGLLGKEVVNLLKNSAGYDIYWTSRDGRDSSIAFNIIGGDITQLIHDVRPDLVINATVVKHWRNGSSAIRAREMFIVNSWFPRKLTRLAHNFQFNFIHISTNAVFSGFKGNYGTNDFTFPASYYGITKRLGECKSSRTLTIRTSFVQDKQILNNGQRKEAPINNSLKRKIKVSTKDIWNGVTDSILSNLILGIAKNSEFIFGLYHFVPAGSLSKIELLSWCNQNLWNGTITLEEKHRIWGRRLTLISQPDTSQLLWKLAGYNRTPYIGEIFTSAEPAQSVDRYGEK